MTGVVVCAAVAGATDVCRSLLSASVIGVNVDTVTGESGGAETVPDVPAGVWRVPGVLGAETVVRRRVEMRVAGVRVFLCDSLERKEQWAASCSTQ